MAWRMLEGGNRDLSVLYCPRQCVRHLQTRLARPYSKICKTNQLIANRDHPTMNTPKDKPASKLNVTFEGPDIHNGTSLDDFQKTLDHVQTALRRMIQHLRGEGSSRLLKSAKQMGSLRIVGISPGSVVAELELPTPQHDQVGSEKHGQRAIDEILSWEGEDDDSLPQDVAEELQAIGINVSEDVDTVRLGNPSHGKSVLIKRKPKPARRRRRASQTIDAILFGSLKEINWDKGTAQLHRFNDKKHVPLRFHTDISDNMQRLATQFVKVTGYGRLNAGDQWTIVIVELIEPTRPDSVEYEIDDFLNDPNPKLFDPGSVVVASEPFDVDIFIRDIHNARDVERER